ncbi:family 10 glycosylhydrolase [Methylomagnum sp.]
MLGQKDSLVLHGAEIMPGEDGKQITTLKVRGNQYAEFRPHPGITGAKGVISLWIKPLWDAGASQSHTIFSMPWNDGKSGYMALSWGWWEPSYSQRLLFILNNQEGLACSTDSPLEVNEWNMITVVWNNADKPGCKLFVDGEKLAQRDLAYQGNYTAMGRMYLGSDIGSTEARGRLSDFEIKGLRIQGQALSEDAAYQLYQAESKRFPGLAERTPSWLKPSALSGQKVPVTVDGKLVQNRVIFDESAEWATSELYTNRLLARLKKAGFNVLIPCVWHGRGTHYPTPLSAMDPTIKTKLGKQRDPLAALIQKAHALGIEVHPWFTVVRREDNQWPEYYEAGTPADAYDIHNERFRDNIVGLILDVVKRYEVDGINLDYIRAMGICESAHCQQDYAAKTGHILRDDLPKAAPGSPEHERIRAWQGAAVTDIVARFSKAAKKIRPRLVVSVDGHPELDPAKRDLEGRDEIAWIERGLIDVVFNMDYRRKPDVEGIATVMRHIQGKGALIQIFGNYDQRGGRVFPRPGQIVAGYADYAGQHWSRQGSAYYIASALSDDQIFALSAGPFKAPAITSWSSSHH